MTLPKSALTMQTGLEFDDDVSTLSYITQQKILLLFVSRLHDGNCMHYH